MHLVYFILTGGGPEAFIKNIATDLKNQGIKVSVVLSKPTNNVAHKFPDYINVFELKRGSQFPYYLYLLFRKFKVLLPILAYLLRYVNETRLLKTLQEINKNNPINAIEVVEGQFIDRVSKKWTTITRAHGSNWSFRHFCKDGNSDLDRYLIKWQRKQHLKSFKNFAISEHTRYHLTQFCRLPKSLIEFVPYPIDLRKFSEAKPAIIEDIDSNAPLILSIGRLESRKGMDVLVKAMNEIWDDFPEACLLLLGKESEFTLEDLKALVAENKRSKIIHPGFVHYSKIPSYYKAATIYVSASEYETFGYTLLESMAAGTPVIATNRGAMPELIEHGENGLLCEFGNVQGLTDSIRLLLNSKEKRIIYSKAGLQKARSFDIAVLGAKIIKSYLQILSS